MRIPKKAIIEKACSDDELRPAMCHPYFNGKRIIATNGHILVSVPVEVDEKEDDASPRLINIEALQKARKLSKGDMTIDFRLVKEGIVVEGITFPNPDVDGEFPDTDKVVNGAIESVTKAIEFHRDVNNIDALRKKSFGVFQFAINLSKLKQLTDALPNSYWGGVHIITFGDHEIFIVLVGDDSNLCEFSPSDLNEWEQTVKNKAIGLIMPVRINKENK